MDHDDLPNEAETCRKRKDAGRESASEREEDSSASKKPRVVWSAEMHLQFVHAVNQLGIDSEWRKAGRGRAGGGGRVFDFATFTVRSVASGRAFTWQPQQLVGMVHA